jgi:hypothetical protein
MIVIKEVPGLTPRETLEALLDMAAPDGPPVTTGHGGFVVDEDTAERFLLAYLTLTGKRPPVVEDKPRDVEDKPRDRVETKTPRPAPRRAGRRKEVS